MPVYTVEVKETIEQVVTCTVDANDEEGARFLAENNMAILIVHDKVTRSVRKLIKRKVISCQVMS